MQSVIAKPNKNPSDALSCDAANKLLFDANSGIPENCRDNRLTSVYNALANQQNPDFAVMSDYLSSFAKGWVSKGYLSGKVLYDLQLSDPGTSVQSE